MIDNKKKKKHRLKQTSIKKYLPINIQAISQDQER